MNGGQTVKRLPVHLSDGAGAAAPVWWLMFKWELAELWLGGRALTLLILFSILMSITSILRELESQFSMIPPAEIVFITLQAAISFGLFIGLIIGADSISGERERSTLEPLLLTPASRSQVVAGKFLAALSVWPAALALSVPYMIVLARGDEVWRQAVLLGSVFGSLLAIGFTAFGMLVSLWSNSNKVSLFVSLLFYVLLLIPTLWPGTASKGDLGYLVQQLNPMQGTSGFLEKVLVNNRTVEEKFPYVVANILLATAVPALLFLYAAPRLRLEGGAPRLSLPPRRGATGLLLIACLFVSLGIAAPVHAAASPAADLLLQIAIDLDHQVVNAGDKIEFNTVVSNQGTQASAPLFVAMNIIKLGSGIGDPVDPEDWSPERTQAAGRLAPGQSVKQSWLVHAILEGNYMVYMTVVPEPGSAEATSQPISSSGIHVTVHPFEKTNPGGVLPVAIATPVVLAAGTLLIRRRGRRGTPQPAD